MKEAYTAAREGAAFLDRSDRGRIVLTGADRASYLQGLLTNDIAALTPGTGCYAAYLTPQGRMIADMWVYELGDTMLVTLHHDVKDAVLARFDQFVFAEDVKLGDVTATFAQVAIVGPQAAAALSRVLEDVDAAALRMLAEHGNRRAAFAGTPCVVTAISDLGEAGYDVYVASERKSRFIDALRSAGVVEIDAETAEAIRIEAGVPLFHRDMDEDTIPLEAGIETRAISFTKGCYVGQEVIVRVLHRGHGRVARKLVGLRVDGDRVPAAGAAIRAGEKDVGHVTSAAWSPRLDRPVALGYVQRDYAEPDTSVAISASSAGGNASDVSSARVTHRSS